MNAWIACLFSAISCAGLVGICLQIDKSVRKGEINLYAFSTSIGMYFSIFFALLMGLLTVVLFVAAVR